MLLRDPGSSGGSALTSGTARSVRNVFKGTLEFWRPEDLVRKIVVAAASLATGKMCSACRSR